MNRTPAERARNRLALTTRWHGDEPEKVEAARRDLATEKIAAHIERVVAEAPPLTDAQRDRLAALLNGGGGRG